MADGVALAGWLLVAGTIVGLAPVGNPSLLRIWSVSRAEHISIVAAHRRGWYALNAGFIAGTAATIAGLALTAAAIDGDGDGAGRAGLIAGTVGYAVGGVLWSVMLAIRARVTPALAGLDATGPAARLLDEAQGGLFGAFVLTTAVALIVIGIALAVGGQVSIVVAALAVLVGVAALVLQLATGDLVPAVLYLPTLVLGIALLIGWT